MTYRDAPLPCPRCATSLDVAGPRWACRRCRGTWVTRTELLDLVRSMAPDLHPESELPIGRRPTVAPLACPHDGAKLDPGRLGNVAIDHCRHGVWFDGDELARTLQRIGEWYADRETGRRLAGGRIVGGPLPQWEPDTTGHETLGELLRHVVRWILRYPPEP